VTTVDVTGSVPHFPRRDVAAFARRVLRELEISGQDVAIALVDDESMRDLNRKFRRKNKTTDVLTFPGGQAPSPVQPLRRKGQAGAPVLHHLGDIVISIDQARRQAAEEKHSLPTEVRYLVLHGILHALGYDHETDQGEMNALELKLRMCVGLP